MKKPIRILHVLQRMEAGGTQALLMNLYRKIDRSKVQFDFFVEYPDKQFYDDEITKMGGKIYYTNVRKDFNILKFQKQLKKVLIENEYKIVHVHAFTIGYFALKTAKKCNVPVRIAHSHNNETVRDSKYLLKKFMQKIYPIHANDLFACSEDAGRYLFGNKKFCVLNNAIDSEKFIFFQEKREKARKELNLTNNFVVGHVGRFHPQKNHDFLLEIFSKIKEKRKDAKLILIGSGPLEDEIKEKIKKLNLEDSVMMLGNRNDMDFMFQAMDVFIFPSLFEGLGIVAIEAQASGTPIIISDGVPDTANITPICKKIKLTDSASKWAEEAIKIAKSNLAHTNLQKYIIEAGFDMQSTVNWLEDFYLSSIKSK